MLNFAKVLEADLNSEKGGGSRKRIVPGTYKATISKVAQHIPESGSVSLLLEYTVIEGDLIGATISEYICTKGRADKGGLDLPNGLAKIKRRLMTVGFTTDDISKMKSPKTPNPNDTGDFRKLLSRDVSITVDNELQKGGKFAGISKPAVKRVEAIVSEE